MFSIQILYATTTAIYDKKKKCDSNREKNKNV
jgi:hypothetical protein